MPVIPINDRVRLITGPVDSRFPYANAFFVDDEVRTLVDAGCDEAEIEKLGRVDRIVCTHYHLDHIRKVWRFPDAELWVPDVEAHVFRGGLEALSRQVGVEPGWAASLPTEPRPIRYSMRDQYEWRLSLRAPARAYGDGEVIVCGETKIETIRTPGHTPGHTCPFFQKENLLHLVDVDLSSWGPWYGGNDGDLDAFERSIQRLLKFPATLFTTAHSTELIRGEAVRPKLEAYLRKLAERDERILERLRRGPLPLESLMREGIVFPADRQAADDWIALWERNMLRKHLERLARSGRVRAENGLYAAA
jgi:glyoxylase-like metal-dependent hydrolase (beta-lactamase superfamily II)